MIRAGLKNVFLITGAVMGAGYASGQEIWQFFGRESGLAILLFTLFFIICTTTILQISYQLKTSNYVPILYHLTGKTLATIYDYLILIYLFSVTIVMIAGSGATFESFGIPYWWGIVFIVLGLVIIFSKGIEELLTINQVLMPFLILALGLMLVIFIRDEGISLTIDWHRQGNWASAFPFTALNVLPLIAVLGAIGNRIHSKGEIYFTSITSGLILGSITIFYNTGLIHLNEKGDLPSIPLYGIISDYHNVILLIMMLMLWIAIYTTAAATLLGIITRINKKHQFSLIKVASLLLVLMLPFSAIGFTQLIAFLYPLYGILNLYIFVKLITYPLWRKKHK